MKKSHLRNQLDTLKPWEATEKMDKCEAVEWAFTEGYKYRKFLDLGLLYGSTRAMQKVTSEVLQSRFPATDPQDQDYNTPEVFLDGGIVDPPTSPDKVPFYINYGELEEKAIAAEMKDLEKQNEINAWMGKLGKGAAKQRNETIKKVLLSQHFTIITNEKLKNVTCPACLNNPETTQIFSMNEISMKLYDAKFRSIIDGDQLFKLLDYFEEKIKNEDNN